MVKTITFNKKGMPVKLESGIKTSKDFHWMHVDQKDDESVYDLISYELSDLGLSKDLSQNPRPSIRCFKNYEIIKLTFPREAGLYHNEGYNLIVRFVITKDAIITMSNSSDELLDLMNDIYVNKKIIRNTKELFGDILTAIVNKSYETLQSLDGTINEIRKNIFENVKKKENYQQSEELRERVYHMHMYLLANTEVFEQLRDEGSGIISYDHKIEHIRSRINHLKDAFGGQKENLSHVSDLYLGMISANMGKYMYKLTILSAILLVPTIVSGLFGMNVDLPGVNFWPILLITIILAVSSGAFMSWWAKK